MVDVISTRQWCIALQLERELRLLRARCNVLEGQLKGEKPDTERGDWEVDQQTAPATGSPLPETSDKESQPQDVSEAAGASLLQAKLAGLAGRPRSAVTAAKLERAASGKSTSMRRFAQEAGCLVREGAQCAVELTPAGERVGVFSVAAGGLGGVPGAAAAPKAAQGTPALPSRRMWLSSGKPPAAGSAQEHSVKADREKWQVGTECQSLPSALLTERRSSRRTCCMPSACMPAARLCDCELLTKELDQRSVCRRPREG